MWGFRLTLGFCAAVTMPGIFTSLDTSLDCSQKDVPLSTGHPYRRGFRMCLAQPGFRAQGNTSGP